MPMRIFIETSEAERYLERLPTALRDRAFGQALLTAAERYADRVRSALPTRTGRTRASVKVGPVAFGRDETEPAFTTVFGFVVYSDWMVARFLEGGTQPHEIVPIREHIRRVRERKVKRALKRGKEPPEFEPIASDLPRALKIGGKFFASVDHPGIAARPVWHPEAERAFAGLDEDVANVVDQVLQER
jgi:hypothetical protein